MDAIVVCRQLGHHTALNATAGTFGEGSGPIWLDHVYCSSRESNLTQCWSSHRLSDSCSHSKDAGVICSGVWSWRLCPKVHTLHRRCNHTKVECIYSTINKHTCILQCKLLYVKYYIQAMTLIQCKLQNTRVKPSQYINNSAILVLVEMLLAWY